MLNAIWLRWFQPEMSLELQVIAANTTFTSTVTGPGAYNLLGGSTKVTERF